MVIVFLDKMNAKLCHDKIAYNKTEVLTEISTKEQQVLSG
ncbi:hypothetical protein B6N60_00088 [Richelia sinica FACHB-800]|uniref:Uncharacterized protein n=1 Tax=Richelia sinica FACHB-800 TaxID=1357546 RepID=A0A975T3K3_9NOST|nr:hypothetical protein B6N60_00088 [Richelia sinica FACHB-800]